MLHQDAEPFGICMYAICMQVHQIGLYNSGVLVAVSKWGVQATPAVKKRQQQENMSNIRQTGVAKSP